MSVMLPPDTTFTRSALTKASTYLFLNPLDPTPSTYIFRPYTGYEQLLGSSYSYPFSMYEAARATHAIVERGLFDNTVFDDIFRAYLVAGARKFRDRRDLTELHDAQICLDEATYMLTLHRVKNGENGYGDNRLYDILENIIVPGTPAEILSFIAKDASDIFLKKLSESKWLQEKIDVIAPLASSLSPSECPEHNGVLLCVLAKYNRLNEIKMIESWQGFIDDDSYERAIEIASESEHIELATYLVSLMQKVQSEEASVDMSTSTFLEDLML